MTDTPSRFRPSHRALTDDEKQLLDAIKTKAAELEDLYNTIPSSRHTSLALTSLEESVMCVVKALTA